MSLLLDALKRAEQEKHSRNGERTVPRPEPQPAPPPAAANSPTGALELQPLGSAAKAQQRSESAAHAAQVVFRAKTAHEEAAANRGMLWATIGVIAIVVAAAAAYVWYSLRMLTPQLSATAAMRPPPAPTPLPASGMTIGELPGAAAAAPPIDSVAAPAAAPEPPKLSPPPRAAHALVSELLREAPALQPAPLRLARTPDARARVPVEIVSGYAALRGGDLAAARRSYQAALAADARSLDAHLGMATVEARSGNRPSAAGHYRKALDVDPRNPTALAGLAALADYGRAEGLESRLREDIARNPASGALHFALGNMFASQSRWHEAQAEYFEARRLEPDNADIAYNLAVSLDHLGQARLAAEQYRLALEASRSQPAQFDTREVEQRLALLAAGAR